MNRTALLNQIERLIDHNAFDRNKLNSYIQKQLGKPSYNQLPLYQLESLHSFLIETSKQNTKLS